MLYIHHSNQLEELAQSMISSFEKNNTPLAPHIIVTESNPLSRWIEQQFCKHDGIRCLVETPLPAEWLWSTARKLLELSPAEDSLSREKMQWRLNDLLQEESLLTGASDGERVLNYLQNDETGLKRWQLAARIADCFDRYQYYRPKELIQQWDSGQDNQWQAILWREITTNTDTHRVRLMQDFHEKLSDAGAKNILPERIDLFSLHSLPPLLLDAYTAIAEYVTVNFWLLSPTADYWADLISPKQDARMRIEDPAAAALSQKGNRLLVQWGAQGQAFQDLLLDSDMSIAQESEQFHEPLRNNLLHNVQADIFEALDNESTPVTIDSETPLPSIQVDICHNPMRECQVLHDRILHCLKADKTLQPEDILIMSPQISQYAPYINAVFGRPPAQGEPRLPYNISDVLLADEHPLIRAFLDLLNLPESRFTRSEIMGLMNIPEIRRNFDLQESDTALLAELFNQLRTFWGLSGNDKKSRHSLPAINDNTWQQAFDRVMAGYALGLDDLYQQTTQTIAPEADMASHNAERAARFFSLLDTLRNWSKTLKDDATVDEWVFRLSDMLEAIFGKFTDEEKRLDAIRLSLSELKKDASFCTKPVNLNIIRHWLTGNLSSRTERSRPFSGGITFCAMRPQRGVPFQIIGLLGMQERAFPRQQSRLEFDLMAKKPKYGDPNFALEDRYLFLEAMLAARKKLIISYTGKHLRTNKDLQPSVLVQELLDYIDARYQMDEKPVTDLIQQVHPLQAFSPNNFTNTELPGFDRRWQKTANALREHQPPVLQQGWPDFFIKQTDEFIRQVSPAELGAFLKKPLRKFIQRRLSLFEPQDIELLEDEPLHLNHLEQWSLRDQLIRFQLQGKTDEGQQKLKAQGLLPHGTPGKHLLQSFDAEVEEILSQRPLKTPLLPEAVDIDLPFTVSNNRWQMIGRLQSVYVDTGLLQVSASKYKIIDLLPLWVEHLCLHIIEHPLAGTARYICRDGAYSLSSLDAEPARNLLNDLMTIFERGLISPLPIMPASTSAWFSQWSTNENTDAADKKALGEWNGNQTIPGEKEDFETKLILRGHDWQPDEELGNRAKDILESLNAHLTPLHEEH